MCATGAAMDKICVKTSKANVLTIRNGVIFTDIIPRLRDEKNAVIRHPRHRPTASASEKSFASRRIMSEFVQPKALQTAKSLLLDITR